MAPRQKYTCLLCDTEKWTCTRAAKELIGETVKKVVYLDTDHHSYSAVRERVRTLIQANRLIEESDRFCIPCADHHMAGLRRKNVVPEKTVGGVCKFCKKDNAEHVLKAGMCPKCWITHQETCLRNEYAEDGVTCEKCRATDCGGKQWYTGSEDGTHLCQNCYLEKTREAHRALGTKCAKCGKSECGGQYWYKGSEDGTYLCRGCYEEKTRAEHRALGTTCATCGKSECGGSHWLRGPEGTYLCKVCYAGMRKAKKSGGIYTPRGTPLTRMTTPCELCGEEETWRWHSGPRAGTRICHACYYKKQNPSKKRKATAASAGTHAQGVVRKIIKKTNAAAFSLAGCSTRGGSAAA